MLAIRRFDWQAMDMSNNGETLSIPEPPLLKGELKGFIQDDIWPATKYLLGVNFKDIAKDIDGSNQPPPISLSIESPNGMDEVKLDFHVGDRRYHRSPSIVVNVEGFCSDLTDVLPQDIKGPTVWDVSSFIFPINMRRPSARRFLIMRNRHGNQILKLNSVQRNFLDQASEQFGLKRNAEMGREDLRVIQDIIHILSNPKID